MPDGIHAAGAQTCEVMMRNTFWTLLLGLLATAYLSPASAVPDTVTSDLAKDTPLFAKKLENHGDLTLRTELAEEMGLPLSQVILEYRGSADGLLMEGEEGDAYDWKIDLGRLMVGGKSFVFGNESLPQYFVLKFGIGGTSVATDAFFFRNVDHLYTLEWSNADVAGLMDTSACRNCGMGRLSYFALLYDPPTAVSGVPEPATLALLGLGLAGLGFSRRRTH